MILIIITRINTIGHDEFRDAFKNHPEFFCCPQTKVWVLKGDYLAKGTDEEVEKSGMFVMNHEKVAHKLIEWMKQQGLLKRQPYLLIHGYDTNDAIKNQGLFWLENFTTQEPDEYKKVEDLANRASVGENYDDILNLLIDRYFHKPLIDRTEERVSQYLVNNLKPAHIKFEKDILKLPDGMTIDDLPPSMMSGMLDLKIRFNNIPEEN
ncbi:MAG: hypothetical protein JNM22_06400 [Saprospiraceae bacterium]|nr:hypothetical protein [Saprospiraceae bacterium]